MNYSQQLKKLKEKQENNKKLQKEYNILLQDTCTEIVEEKYYDFLKNDFSNTIKNLFTYAEEHNITNIHDYRIKVKLTMPLHDKYAKEISNLKISIKFPKTEKSFQNYTFKIKNHYLANYLDDYINHLLQTHHICFDEKYFSLCNNKFYLLYDIRFEYLIRLYISELQRLEYKNEDKVKVKTK